MLHQLRLLIVKPYKQLERKSACPKIRSDISLYSHSFINTTLMNSQEPNPSPIEPLQSGPLPVRTEELPIPLSSKCLQPEATDSCSKRPLKDEAVIPQEHEALPLGEPKELSSHEQKELSLHECEDLPPKEGEDQLMRNNEELLLAEGREKPLHGSEDKFIYEQKSGDQPDEDQLLRKDENGSPRRSEDRIPCEQKDEDPLSYKDEELFPQKGEELSLYKGEQPPCENKDESLFSYEVENPFPYTNEDPPLSREEDSSSHTQENPFLRTEEDVPLNEHEGLSQIEDENENESEDESEERDEEIFQGEDRELHQNEYEESSQSSLMRNYLMQMNYSQIGRMHGMYAAGAYANSEMHTSKGNMYARVRDIREGRVRAGKKEKVKSSLKLCEMQSLDFEEYEEEDSAKVFEYTDDKGKIEILKSDIARLDEALTPNILNLYFRYYANEGVSVESRGKISFLPKDFYLTAIASLKSSNTREEGIQNQSEQHSNQIRPIELSVCSGAQQELRDAMASTSKKLLVISNKELGSQGLRSNWALNNENLMRGGRIDARRFENDESGSGDSELSSRERDVSSGREESRSSASVDLFEKEYVIMPVCEQDKWILVVLVNPGAAFNSPAKGLYTSPATDLCKSVAIDQLKDAATSKLKDAAVDHLMNEEADQAQEKNDSSNAHGNSLDDLAIKHDTIAMSADKEIVSKGIPAGETADEKPNSPVECVDNNKGEENNPKVAEKKANDGAKIAEAEVNYGAECHKEEIDTNAQCNKEGVQEKMEDVRKEEKENGSGGHKKDAKESKDNVEGEGKTGANKTCDSKMENAENSKIINSEEDPEKINKEVETRCSLGINTDITQSKEISDQAETNVEISGDKKLPEIKEPEIKDEVDEPAIKEDPKEPEKEENAKDTQLAAEENKQPESMNTDVKMRESASPHESGGSCKEEDEYTTPRKPLKRKSAHRCSKHRKLESDEYCTYSTPVRHHRHKKPEHHGSHSSHEGSRKSPSSGELKKESDPNSEQNAENKCHPDINKECVDCNSERKHQNDDSNGSEHNEGRCLSNERGGSKELDVRKRSAIIVFASQIVANAEMQQIAKNIRLFLHAEYTKQHALQIEDLESRLPLYIQTVLVLS